MICECGLEKEVKALFTSVYEECLRCDILSHTITEEQPRWKEKKTNYVPLSFDTDYVINFDDAIKQQLGLKS